MLIPTEKQESNTMTCAVCDVISHWKTTKLYNDLCCNYVMLIPTGKQENNTMTCAVRDVISHWKTRKQHNDLCCLWCYFPLKNNKTTQWRVLFLMLFPTEKQQDYTMTCAVIMWCYFPLKNKKATQWLVLFVMLFLKNNTWLVVSTPLNNMKVNWEGLFPIYGNSKKPCSKPPTRYFINHY